MARYQVLIEYVGTSFRGWQIQKKGSTIQGLIQQHLSKLLNEKIIKSKLGMISFNDFIIFPDNFNFFIFAILDFDFS